MGRSISLDDTVARITVDHPGLIRFFEKLGIDFCCGGEKTLQAACADAGVEAETVVLTLNALTEKDGETQTDDPDWSQTSLSELCDHIETTHHRYLLEELPQLEVFVDRVSQVHGDQHPNLHRVKEVFVSMRAELLDHLEKEEKILFPLIRAMEAGDEVVTKETVARPIRQMEEEHDASGDDLKTLRRLTDDYQPPANACGTYRAMLSGLVHLEKDLHRHIHKENNILFPRAMAHNS